MNETVIVEGFTTPNIPQNSHYSRKKLDNAPHVSLGPNLLCKTSEVSKTSHYVRASQSDSNSFRVLYKSEEFHARAIRKEINKLLEG